MKYQDQYFSPSAFRIRENSGEGEGSRTIYLIKMVVEINVGCAEIPPKQCGVSGKNRSDRKVPGSRKDQSSSGLPFVELGNDMFAVHMICHLRQEGSI